ncbi:MAG: flavoprotein [Opitutales bacterium]
MVASPLTDKTILLGVSGSIAAYKSADLVSRFREAGANVDVVMTDGATRFVTPLTLQTLARRPVSVDQWAEGADWQPGHIELADRADLMLVAPATAHRIGLMAQGLAPDLLSSIYLATPAPVIIAPAMNGKMLAHPAVRANLETLTARGHRLVEPDSGMLACGYAGSGKLASVERIVEAVLAHFAKP